MEEWSQKHLASVYEFLFYSLFAGRRQSQTTHGEFNRCLFQPHYPGPQQTPNDTATGDVHGDLFLFVHRTEVHFISILILPLVGEQVNSARRLSHDPGANPLP
ncbi:uncharacterized [Tachysurus ichikawai]